MSRQRVGHRLLRVEHPGERRIAADRQSIALTALRDLDPADGRIGSDATVDVPLLVPDAERREKFANRLRVQWVWARPLPEKLDLEKTGPLLCGGVTVFTPFLAYNIPPTARVGVIGIGGLGHMALQFANKWGCEVHAFKAPSENELDHDFLWRTTAALPSRGRIGIFNRSYYEETIVVRVHPELLQKQRLPERLITANIWQQRFGGDPGGVVVEQ